MPVPSADIIQKNSFSISDIDDSSNPKYYGFVNAIGEWYILKENTSTKQYRYIRGKSDYSSNWSNHSSLTYGLYSEVF